MLAQVDLEGGLEEAWRDIATVVPKLLAFFLILLIGWFVAKALSSLTDRLLERVGFDGWVERGSLRAPWERNRTDPSDVAGILVFWVVFLIALQLAFGIWGPNPISDLLEGIIAYLPKILVAVVILVIAGAIARAVTDVLLPVLGGVSGGQWIARAAGIAVLVIGVFAALSTLEIAPMIVNGLFYAILVALVGAFVIAFGGGGIPVARNSLERWRTRAEVETADLRQRSRVHADAERTQELATQPEPPMPPVP